MSHTHTIQTNYFPYVLYTHTTKTEPNRYKPDITRQQSHLVRLVVHRGVVRRGAGAGGGHLVLLRRHLLARGKGARGSAQYAVLDAGLVLYSISLAGPYTVLPRYKTGPQTINGVYEW